MKITMLIMMLCLPAAAEFYQVPGTGPTLPIAQASAGHWRLTRIHDNPQAVGLRDLARGEYLAGAQKELVALYDPANREMLHLSFFTAWQAHGGNPAYGPSVGTNVGSLGRTTSKVFGYLVPEIQSKIENYAPWAQKMADLLSVESFVGYRPNSGQMIWGYGAKIGVPVDQALAWMGLN